VKLYLDTGLLASYYLPEPASEEVESLLRAFPGPAVSDVTELELLALLGHRVRRAALAAADARRVRSLFLSHLEAGLYDRLAVRRRHYLLARDWVGRREVAIGAAEAVHLAVAALEERTLATGDPALAEAAGRLGVGVLPVGLDDLGGMTVHESPALPYGAEAAAAGEASR
jgi:predicted nucleic acid-binding protein